MGQQQLILLVLVFIIVGIAAIVAISTFQQSQNASVHDATRQDILSAISGAQKYYMAPGSIGGGGKSFDGISLQDIALDSVNVNASFEIAGSGNSLIIIGTNPNYDVNLRATVVMSGSGGPVITWEDI